MRRNRRAALAFRAPCARVALLFATVVVVLAGLPDVARGEVTSSVAEATRDCRAPIDTTGVVPKGFRRAGSAVAIQTGTLGGRAALQTTIDPTADPVVRYHAKSPLFVRTGGQSARIQVPSKWIGRLAVAWGNSGPLQPATHAITIGPCDGQAGGSCFQASSSWRSQRASP